MNSTINFDDIHFIEVALYDFIFVLKSFKCQQIDANQLVHATYATQNQQKITETVGRELSCIDGVYS